MPNTSCISHLLPSLNKSHLTHQDIAPLITALENEPLVDVQLIAHSFENRPLHLLTLGQGPTVIFAWTQMHGNEATATAAVFDLIDQLIQNQKESLKEWASAFTLHILPMLNPDGAERCIRQNAQSIDINRDARELQTPEGKALMAMVDQLAPDIGFNLHDQSPYYQCGDNTNPATIAFLAPAFDVDKTIDAARERAMVLISQMNKTIQTHIPNCVARYDDTYSVRAFGDNIAAKNVSTILIESGAARGDDNRQIARKMNVIAMQSAFEYLLNTSNSETTNEKHIADYFAIPPNVSETLSSVVIRNLTFAGKHTYKAGVSIKQTARYSNQFFVDFTGDLHTQSGLVEFDATGSQYQQGRVFEVTSPIEITNEYYASLLRDGYVYFHDPKGVISNSSDFDICTVEVPIHEENAFILQQAAYCLFVKEGEPSEVHGAMLNGKLISFSA
jgi:predicted deacylase